MNANATSRRHSAWLSGLQSAIMLMAGIALWFAAARLLHALNAAGILGGGSGIAVFAAVVPGTAPFVLLLQRLGRLGIDQIVPGYALATLAALACDGVAVTWHPALYGETEAAVRLAAGAVLFGAAVGLALAFALAALLRTRELRHS